MFFCFLFLHFFYIISSCVFWVWKSTAALFTTLLNGKAFARFSCAFSCLCLSAWQPFYNFIILFYLVVLSDIAMFVTFFQLYLLLLALPPMRSALQVAPDLLHTTAIFSSLRLKAKMP